MNRVAYGEGAGEFHLRGVAAGIVLSYTANFLYRRGEKPQLAAQWNERQWVGIL